MTRIAFCSEADSNSSGQGISRPAGSLKLYCRLHNNKRTGPFLNQASVKTETNFNNWCSHLKEMYSILGLSCYMFRQECAYLQTVYCKDVTHMYTLLEISTHA